jgi:hypothetical protein
VGNPKKYGKMRLNRYKKRQGKKEDGAKKKTYETECEKQGFSSPLKIK